MKDAIAEIGTHDLRIAVKALYCAASVLRHLPYTPADSATKAALYGAAKLSVRSVWVVLAEILERLEHFEAQEVIQ